MGAEGRRGLGWAGLLALWGGLFCFDASARCRPNRAKKIAFQVSACAPLQESLGPRLKTFFDGYALERRFSKEAGKRPCTSQAENRRRWEAYFAGKLVLKGEVVRTGALGRAAAPPVSSSILGYWRGAPVLQGNCSSIKVGATLELVWDPPCCERAISDYDLRCTHRGKRRCRAGTLLNQLGRRMESYERTLLRYQKQLQRVRQKERARQLRVLLYAGLGVLALMLVLFVGLARKRARLFEQPEEP